MRRAFLPAIAAAALCVGCGADTGDGLDAFGEVAEDAEEALYACPDHPSGDLLLLLRGDGTFLLSITPWRSATLRAKKESLEGTWRVDDGELALVSGEDEFRYRQGTVDIAIPGWSGPVKGLGWEEGTRRIFATDFDLVDNGELSAVMDAVMHGD